MSASIVIGTQAVALQKVLGIVELKGGNCIRQLE